MLFPHKRVERRRDRPAGAECAEHFADALAALVHVYIFVLESVQWTTPRVWRRFGVADQNAAETIRPMAYNQGFYNLFLALGAALGLVLFWVGGDAQTVADVAGRTLVLFALGSMLAASLVLLTTGRRYLPAVLLQGAVPAIGFVLFLRPSLLPVDRDLVTLIGFGAIVGGAVTLVWRLRSGDDDDDLDDGAVV